LGNQTGSLDAGDRTRLIGISFIARKPNGT
jgi:hypothetical protein